MAAFRDRKPYTRPGPRPRGADGEWLHDKAPGAPRSRGRTSEVVEQTTTSTVPSAKLIISNLHYEITPKDLAAIFGTKGTLVREPHIRYDRSGRSSGTAIVTYETVAEAAAAKREYDGRLAKEQPMSIEFYNPPPRRSASAPSSLLNRIQKPPLLDRLGQELPRATRPAPPLSTGPIRTKPRRSTGAPRAPRGLTAPRAPKKPVSAEDLDKELDTFMQVESTTSTSTTTVVGGAGVGASVVESAAFAPPGMVNGNGQPIQDVEMA